MQHLSSLFVSHGAPTFALAPGLAGPRLTALGKVLPRPTAVLVVSPHWMTAQPRASMAAQPATIHDFGGFDPALYRLEYPAQGHPVLAQRAVELLRLAGWRAELDASRGLDHGAWVPMRYLYPDATVPTFQVSMPARLDAHAAYAFGQALAPIANEGVLVVGSGSLTHNLDDFRGHRGPTEADGAYVTEFEAWVREAVALGDTARLLRTLADAPHARRAHPTPEHFWPLLVAAGAAPAVLPVQVIEGGTAHCVLSMDAYAFGMDDALDPVGARPASLAEAFAR